MEPESPSPYPQVPATCPYPESTPSSAHDPLQLPDDPAWYYPPIYVLVSPMASFPQASPPTPCAHIYPPPYAPHALPISFVSILPAASANTNIKVIFLLQFCCFSYKKLFLQQKV